METFCVFYDQNSCRSCTEIAKSYVEQLQSKEDELKRLLHVTTLEPSVLSAETGFRNKAKMIVSGTKVDPVIGISPDSPQVLSCPLHHPAINLALAKLKDFIKVSALDPYRLATKTGELKGVILFHTPETHETYLRFILRSKEALSRIQKHLPSLLKEVSGLVCVSVNIQPVHQAVLEGREEIFLTERQTITLSINRLRIEADPRAFIQTNQAVAGLLYLTAANWARALGVRVFMELFSGLGVFSFHVAPFVEAALGIEINPSAVARANQAAHSLGFPHVKFLAVDVANVSGEIQRVKPDLLLVNPPRRGLGEALSLVNESGAKYLIYSSCQAQTLAEDAKKLTHYRILRAQIFDMFPHTLHFETLVLLERTISS